VDIEAVRGSTYGSGDGPARLCPAHQAVENGRLDLDALVTHQYAITKINDALRAMREGSGIRQVIRFA